MDWWKILFILSIWKEMLYQTDNCSRKTIKNVAQNMERSCFYILGTGRTWSMNVKWEFSTCFVINTISKLILLYINSYVLGESSDINPGYAWKSTISKSALTYGTSQYAKRIRSGLWSSLLRRWCKISLVLIVPRNHWSVSHTEKAG